MADSTSGHHDLLEQVVASAQDGILAFDTACRYTVWNGAMERISGMPAALVVGRYAFDIFPFLREIGEDAHFHAALAGRSCTATARPFKVPQSGREGFFEAHYGPVFDAAGAVVGGMAMVRDITVRRLDEEERVALARAEAARAVAEAAAKRFAFLAEAGQVLASSLDYEQTFRDVARLAVPTLGDLCIVDVFQGEALQRVAVTHARPEKVQLLETLRRRYPVNIQSPQPAARALRSGKPDVLPEVTPSEVAAATRDAEHAALIEQIGIRSHIAVPLIARGAIVGAISLGITESDRRYGPDDVALAEDLARRAALAVDNARLFQSAQAELAERRRAEEALRLSAARFRAVMEESPLSIQIFRADGTHFLTNRAWEALWGLKMSDLPDYNVLRDAQLEDLGIASFIRRAFAGEAVEIPAARYDPDATLPGKSQHEDPVRWVRAFAYPVKDHAGSVREVVLVHEDVTARMQAEERVRASEERLRLAVMSARMNVWIWDLATGVVECSEGADAFWGIAVGRGEDFIKVIHPEDLHMVTGAADSALAGDGAYLAEYRLQHQRDLPGQERWVQSRGRVERGRDGRAARIVGVTMDITDLKMAEAATRLLADVGEVVGASLDAHATLQNLARVVVPRMADWCAVDLIAEDGTLERVTVNHPDAAKVSLAQQLFERYPPRQSDAKGVWKVIASAQPEWAPEISDDILRAVAYDDAHLQIMRSLGLKSYVQVPLIARDKVIGALTLVYAESGRRYRQTDVDLVRDLARRAATAVDNARLYQQLRAEDRRKDEFLATLAHELRNPLAPLRAGLEVLRLAGPGQSTTRTREIMERQLGHMVRLIDDLLDLSRVTRGKVQLHKEHVELAAVVNTALEASKPLIDASGLTLAVHLPQQPLFVDGDRTRLAQVLSNLLNNAAKYTERGGHVELVVCEDRDQLIIKVKDTGVGIPPEMLTQVFEMFAQVGRSLERSQGGLGIGLTLVKGLVELHGGLVWAESPGPGQGSTFCVQLPRAAEAVAPLPRDTIRSLPVTASARRVLVVDDNHDAAETLAALLQLEGHAVRTAATGPEALDVARGFSPEVAFLDIGLPGMNGYELARRFREDATLSGAKLVALTGWGQAEDRRLSKEAGFDRHLTKPVDPQDVLALMHE